MFTIQLVLSLYLFIISILLFKIADNKSNYNLESFSIRFIFSFIATIIFILALYFLFI